MSNRRFETTRLMAQCIFGRPVYFENSLCFSCGAAVGYYHVTGLLLAPIATNDGLWTVGGGSKPVSGCVHISSSSA